MPRKILILLLGSAFSVAAFAAAPDCYDMGGTDETCSGGDHGLLGNIVLLFVLVGLVVAFIKDKPFKEGVTKYLLAMGVMVLVVGLAMKIFGKESAMFVAAGFVWYHWSQDPSRKKHTEEDSKSSVETGSAIPTLAEPTKPEVQAPTIDEAENISDPNREFDFHWGVPTDEWFERRYPRIDPHRDELAAKAERRHSDKLGFDLMGADLKHPWLVGYEEGRYAALKITQRTKKQAMRKADNEFNFCDEALKRIFYDGYDAGFEAWKE